MYYETNRAVKSLLYTDHLIYSPGVPWFRTSARNLLDDPFCASVITAPAPNAGQYRRKKQGSDEQLIETLRRRAGYILAVAADNNHQDLLLGAWGCGVFRNDPSVVAKVFADHLFEGDYKNCFQNITFAIYDHSKTQEVIRAFENELADKK